MIDAILHEIPCEKTPFCPWCGADAENFYFKDNECIGCDCCIEKMDYFDAAEFLDNPMCPAGDDGDA